MKTRCTILATILPALCMAAIPVAWTNTPGMPTYALPNVPHGVPIDFSVTLKGYTPIADGADVRLWFQTNGMGKEWWSAPATHNGNVITATFGPAQDCGADRVNLFFGAPSNVFASAVLRLTPSPGFAPNSLPFPAPVLDFSTVVVRNIGALTNGWSFGTATDLSPSTNYPDLVAAGKRDALDLGVRGKPTAENGGVFALDRDMHYTLRWRGTYWSSTHYSYEVHEGGHGFILYERHPVLLGGGGNGLVEICTFDLTQANCYAFSFTKDGERHEIIGYTNLVATLSQVQDALSTGTVYRAASVGTPTRWADATGCVWEVEAAHYSDWSFAGVPDGYVFGLVWHEHVGAWQWTLEQWGGGEDYAQDYFYADDDTGTELTIGVGADFFVGTITCSRTYYPYGTNLVGRVALTNDIPDTASITDDIAAIRAENALVYRLYSGSNVVAEVTNYNSRVHAPELRLMQLNESNEYVTVWAETNGLARVRREANAYTDAATGAVARAAAPRAWSKTTSALGADAPEGVTWVSTPTVVVAGGLEYAKHVTSAGAVWVLASNGLVADVAGSTNAFFRIADESGTNVLFAVERTESLSIGVDASNIVVAAGGDGNDVAIQIPVVSREHPVCYAATNLTDWAAVEQGAEPEWIGMCEWNGEPGAWEFIAGGVVAREAFFRFMVEQEGSTVIRHAAATDISAGIVVNGTNFVPKVTGNTLTWEKAQ